MSEYEHITYEVVAGRGEVLIDRPEKLNAFDDTTIAELEDALRTAMDDERVYVVVLSGRGRGFCSGADVTNMGDRSDRASKYKYDEHLSEIQEVVRLLYYGDKPTVAAVNGPAVGAGCDFALACDLRVMDETAFLREQFVNIGLIPGAGGAWLLARLVGESKAKELVLTGRDVDAEEAKACGLAAEIASEGETMATARELANELRDRPATAVRAGKELVDAQLDFEAYRHAAVDAQWECINDPEHEEAVQALLEDREPEFEREY